tara:strand:- start:3762 stop:4862 length:1101 start_codon:yes stop_codon:yes gene_type:complete
MRQGLKDRIQFNPSNPSRMNMISTDYLYRNSFNSRIGNANCAPDGNCSNVQDASGFWIGTSQNAQQTQRAYYAPFRQPIKGFRKVLDCSSGSPDISSCMLTTEIYKDNYSNCLTPFCTDNGSISTGTIPLTGSQAATRSFTGYTTRTSKPLIRSGMQPNIAGKQNSGLSNTLTATRYSYSYRELINNRRKATQIKKLSTQKPASSTYMSNPQKLPGFGGNCDQVSGCNPSETVYRYNNPTFAVQGAVEASDRITRLKLDTIRGATKCPLPGQTTQHTGGTNCNGIYSVGNLQYSSRTNDWPESTSSYDQVKYSSKFNDEHTEVNYPQVSALARVRGSSGINRYTNGQIIANGSSSCPTNCPPQFLM